MRSKTNTGGKKKEKKYLRGSHEERRELAGRSKCVDKSRHGEGLFEGKDSTTGKKLVEGWHRTLKIVRIRRKKKKGGATSAFRNEITIIVTGRLRHASRKGGNKAGRSKVR